MTLALVWFVFSWFSQSWMATQASKNPPTRNIGPMEHAHQQSTHHHWEILPRRAFDKPVYHHPSLPDKNQRFPVHSVEIWEVWWKSLPEKRRCVGIRDSWNSINKPSIFRWFQQPQVFEVFQNGPIAFKISKVRSAVHLPTSSYRRCPKRPAKNGNHLLLPPCGWFQGLEIHEFFAFHALERWQLPCLFVIIPFSLRVTFLVEGVNPPSPTSSRIRVGIHEQYQSPPQKKGCWKGRVEVKISIILDSKIIPWKSNHHFHRLVYEPPFFKSGCIIQKEPSSFKWWEFTSWDGQKPG